MSSILLFARETWSVLFTNESMVAIPLSAPLRVLRLRPGSQLTTWVTSLKLCTKNRQGEHCQRVCTGPPCLGCITQRHYRLHRMTPTVPILLKNIALNDASVYYLNPQPVKPTDDLKRLWSYHGEGTSSGDCFFHFYSSTAECGQHDSLTKGCSMSSRTTSFYM